MQQPEHLSSGRVFRILIPPAPRQYSGQRWAKMMARALHVVLSGIYLGALVFQMDHAICRPWFLAALVSGSLMFLLDLYESGGFLLQLRGLVTMVKLVLLALLPGFGAASVWVLATIAFCSVISSHAPSGFRYYLVWGRGRIKAAQTRG